MKLRDKINEKIQNEEFDIPSLTDEQVDDAAVSTEEALGVSVAEEEKPTEIVVELGKEPLEVPTQFGPDDVIDPAELEIAVEGTDITVRDLKLYKSQYKKISETRFPNYEEDEKEDVFVYHSLTRPEFNKAFAIGTDIEDSDERAEAREIAVIKTALLYPDPDSDYMKEFFASEEFMRSTLSNEILAETGFKAPKTKRL